MDLFSEVSGSVEHSYILHLLVKLLSNDYSYTMLMKT